MNTPFVLLEQVSLLNLLLALVLTGTATIVLACLAEFKVTGQMDREQYRFVAVLRMARKLRLLSYACWSGAFALGFALNPTLTFVHVLLLGAMGRLLTDYRGSFVSARCGATALPVAFFSILTGTFGLPDVGALDISTVLLAPTALAGLALVLNRRERTRQDLIRLRD